MNRGGVEDKKSEAKDTAASVLQQKVFQPTSNLKAKSEFLIREA